MIIFRQACCSRRSGEKTSNCSRENCSKERSRQIRVQNKMGWGTRRERGEEIPPTHHCLIITTLGGRKQRFFQQILNIFPRFLTAGGQLWTISGLYRPQSHF